MHPQLEREGQGGEEEDVKEDGENHLQEEGDKEHLVQLHQLHANDQEAIDALHEEAKDLNPYVVNGTSTSRMSRMSSTSK